MFAPCSNRKRETAAMIPGRSGQDTSRRPMSGVLLRRVTAANLVSSRRRVQPPIITPPMSTEAAPDAPAA